VIVLYFPESTPSEESSGTTFWTKTATLLLIAEYKELLPLANAGKMRKKTLWAKISAVFRKKGYDITPAQCEGRWKTLMRGLKSVHDHNNKSGNGTKTHPYAKQLEFISDKPNFTPAYVITSNKTPEVDTCRSRSRSPDHLLDSENADITQNADDITQNADDNITAVGNETQATNTVESQSTPSTSEPKAKQRRSNSEVVNVLNEFITSQQTKHEAESTRREKMHSEKMEIFQGFLSIMQASLRNQSQGANCQGLGNSARQETPGTSRHTEKKTPMQDNFWH